DFGAQLGGGFGGGIGGGVGLGEAARDRLVESARVGDGQSLPADTRLYMLSEVDGQTRWGPLGTPPASAPQEPATAPNREPSDEPAAAPLAEARRLRAAAEPAPPAEALSAGAMSMGVPASAPLATALRLVY